MLTYGFVITFLGILRGIAQGLGSTLTFLTILPAAIMQNAAIKASGVIATFQGIMPQTMASFFICLQASLLVLFAVISWKIIRLLRG